MLLLLKQISKITFHHNLFSGTFTKLSRQELKDCIDNPHGSHTTIDAFDYIQENGVNFDDNYQLGIGLIQPCFRKKRDHIRRIKGYHLLQPGDEENLKLAVAIIGPISVSIKATANFLFYKAGVFMIRLVLKVRA